MPYIISDIVEEGQHGCSDELGAILHQGLGVDTFHQHLETTDGDADIRTESCEPEDQILV